MNTVAGDGTGVLDHKWKPHAEKGEQIKGLDTSMQLTIPVLPLNHHNISLFLCLL